MTEDIDVDIQMAIGCKHSTKENIFFISAELSTDKMMGLLFALVNEIQERIKENDCRCKTCEQALVDLAAVEKINTLKKAN